MRAWISLLASILLVRVGSAQVVRVWPHVAPGSERWTQRETTTAVTPFGTVAFRVVTPTLTAYLPHPVSSSGSAVIIAPGGSSLGVSIGAEGENVARWFQRRGIAAFVLEYRLLDDHAPGRSAVQMDSAAQFAIADCMQALKVVRRHATEWRLDSAHVGFVGLSAGGMVASGALLQPDVSARPNLAALVYGAPLGIMPRIPPGLPPILLVWAQDDPIARPAMVRLHDPLRAAGQPVVTRVYDRGGHGFGVRRRERAAIAGWTTRSVGFRRTDSRAKGRHVSDEQYAHESSRKEQILAAKASRT